MTVSREGSQASLEGLWAVSEGLAQRNCWESFWGEINVSGHSTGASLRNSLHVEVREHLL